MMIEKQRWTVDVVLHCNGILFDLDGVLADSVAAIETTWRAWAIERGLPPERVLEHVHGRQALAVVQSLAPQLDAHREVALLARGENAAVSGVRAMSGARELLCQLEGVPWGIVTSCTRELALRRIRACGIPEPVVLITADEVEHGKPHPEGYLRGVAALGLPAGECVAFEDAPAGIDAAVAAGLIVVGVASSHEVTALENAHLWLDNLAELRARSRQASESDNEPPRVALVHRLADPKSA